MPKKTKEEAERTRGLLLQTAIEMLAEKGYENISLEELTESIGLSRGAVYHHFSNKDGLFRASVEFLLEEMGDKIESSASSGPSGGEDPWEGLILGTKEFLDASQAAAYQRIILLDAPSVLGMEEWRKLDDAYTTSTLVTVFAELLPSDQKGMAEALAMAYSGAMNQLSIWVGSNKDKTIALESLIKMLEGTFERTTSV